VGVLVIAQPSLDLNGTPQVRHKFFLRFAEFTALGLALKK
jgi:hypothetical protein